MQDYGFFSFNESRQHKIISCLHIIYKLVLYITIHLDIDAKHLATDFYPISIGWMV